MIPPLEMQHSEDQGTQLSRENVKKFVKSLEDNPLLDGVHIEDVEFGGAVTVAINHRLGRQPRGWIITDITAVAGTGVIRAAWTNKTLTLTSSAACDLDLWVF